MKLSLMPALLAGLIVGCTSSGSPPTLEVVTTDGGTSEIPAGAFCWTRQLGGDESITTCQSGSFEPQLHPVEIATSELNFELPLVGWTLEGFMYPVGTNERESLPIVSAGDGMHLAELPGPGIWDVQVSGRGPEGDASYTFRVTALEP